MSAFQDPRASRTAAHKRASDGLGFDDAPGPKRQALGGGDASAATHTDEQYWMVQWRMPQNRKHKTWDGDGVLVLNKTRATLLGPDGQVLTAGKQVPQSVAVGDQLNVGNKQLEIDRSISRSEYMSGECFGRGAPSALPVPALNSNSAFRKKFVPLKPVTANPFTVPRAALPAASSSKTLSSPDTSGHASATSPQPSSTDALHHAGVIDSCWTANWRKPQQRKHKTWDGDAYVILRAGKLTLLAENGKIIGRKPFEGSRLFSGWKTFIGGREIELDGQIPPSQLPAITGASLEFEAENEPEWDFADTSDTLVESTSVHRSSSGDAGGSPIKNADSSTKKYVAPTSFYGKPAPKPAAKGPLHDPDGEGAIVMKAPTQEHINRFNKRGLPVVPVVIDPILARRLRPHQVEGVKFMYECVMGLRKHEGQGCILADEMGMGKTLQTISLVWTLLKQNPYAGGAAAIGKVLIVCPVTLINNWKNEFHKWLGRDRVGVFVGDKDKAKIKQFINSKIHHVLVIGYERLRSVIAELAYCNPPIGLIIADEGHRLKSASNKTSTMFEALRTPRRIILSGTPIQNDLSEFHAMADFCNPGLLDDYNTFRRVYEVPIVRSRAPDCTKKEAELGESRSAQLLAISRSFVLRRDASILRSYLPPKYEYVVFVTPTPLQKAIFSKILNPDKLDNIIQHSTAESLALINMLTKISNSPILLKAVADKARAKVSHTGDNVAKTTLVEEAVKLLPDRAQVEDVSLSGKLAALANLLRAIRKNTDEKCIIVSHYTSTLNIIEAFCNKKKYSHLRLDGQTPAAKRSEYVNLFNKGSQERSFIFLLSSKAGGVGLNLIGASRLCLIDSDWNPSHDLQSMARIHRDGQKREVFIYRFLTAGTIDEKIFQRQVTKLGLSSTLMGNGKSDTKSDSFTHKDLRDIFTVHEHTACHSHDLLECHCDRDGDDGIEDDFDFPEPDHDEDSEDSESAPGFIAASQVKTTKLQQADKAYRKKKKAELAALGEWTHINCLKLGAKDRIQDAILSALIHSPDPDSSVDGTQRVSTTGSGSKTRISSLLDAVDLSNVLNVEVSSAMTVDDVPGGTISFLFEKSSSAPEDEAMVEAEAEDIDA
ncbi:hypothetical protein FA95DRAFT_1561280 [Auriscalpium vulgare]|uniref:Uncharacterized protein n=1 Tax=Auriscalpium vulgare TaxID=40419 RepID=A0ACB8RNA2_9AGAM|nr:hypothetical protein FA95DRAFT_1561280 [Auriscalpium vulgare]